MSNTTILWFRQDLRTTDNPALDAAVQRGGPVFPVFIWSPDEEQEWAYGGASKWWLHHSLKSLDDSLRELGVRLTIRRGNSHDELKNLIGETGADAVFWNRRYEPAIIERDKKLKLELLSDDIEVQSFNGSLLYEPWEIQTKDGTPYQVFTPFWKSCLEKNQVFDVLQAPGTLESPENWPDSESLNNLELLPKITWDEGLKSSWHPGESGAQKLLDRFLDHVVDGYNEDRNRPDMDGTSRLSPHLHFGEISPRQIWEAVIDRFGTPDKKKKSDADVYLSEVVWREFAYHLIYHFPSTTNKPLRDRYKSFPWEDDDQQFEKWTKGMTGYPIVDAGMRQLWQIGWMHNRVRMIVASFLTKDLLIPWQRGAEWFWDTLVDADLASNTLGWQWTAGCGADAAPYYRIFNPMLQSKKFDPKGNYIRKWIPELNKLPDKWLHAPWEAPDEILAEAGITLGKDYPQPMVDHAEMRDKALQAYESIKAE